MSLRTSAVVLLFVLLLAGCTRPGGEESVAPPDREAYQGGRGMAIVLTNNGSDPFFVKVRVLAVGNVEVAAIERSLDPGESVEKWWTLEPYTYAVRMNYTWDARSGSAASGSDETTVDLQGCPAVSRVAWTLRQQEGAGAVGSAYEGKTCVAAQE